MPAVRTTYYDSGYGMTQKEVHELKRYCKSEEFNKTDLLKACIEDTNIELLNPLYDSIRYGLSYERLCMRDWVPISKIDFYGYQRKCLAKFRNAMILDPDYVSWKQMDIYDYLR